MDASQMKNIVVLKDIPSNIIDEAIVILKNNANIKMKEMIKNKSNSNQNNSGMNNEFIVQEAENVINDYLKRIEKPKENKVIINKMIIKYKKLKFYSFILGAIAFIGILVSIIK